MDAIAVTILLAPMLNPKEGWDDVDEKIEFCYGVIDRIKLAEKTRQESPKSDDDVVNDFMNSQQNQSGW